MNEIATTPMAATYPRSVQPGIPRLSPAPEGWSTLRFGVLLKVVQRPMRMADDGEYDLVTVKRSRGGIASRGRFRGRDISVKSQFYLEAGDFLISRRQIVHGACAVVPEEFTRSIVSNEYAVLRCKPGLDLGFLKYLSHSVYFQQTCFHASIGVHVEKMIFKLEDWLKFRVNVPPLEEQKRIAAGFEAVDAKLAALREKADGLRQFKTGLMQRLFSQELRFTREDGTDFPDWEERKLGDILSVSYGKDHKHLENGEIPVFGSGGVMRHVDTALSEGPAILIGRKGTINKPLFVDGPFWTVDTMFYAKSAREYDPRFVFAVVDQVNWMKYNEATGVPSLNASSIRRVPVNAPTELEEQRKIAAALSALDTKIDAVTDQITQMETFKKGLLQRMFV